jgi:hypothetical protein
MEKKHFLDYKLRILNANGTIMNANTDFPSWFTYEQAKKICNYAKGQRIFRHDGVNFREEIF